MPRYLIQSPHTEEECLRVLDWIAAQGAHHLANYDFGCMTDDHTGYVIVETPSEQDARYCVPPFTRNKARLVELHKFTAEEIKSFH